MAKAHFEILKNEHADILIENDPQLFSLAEMRKPGDFEGELNQLIEDSIFRKLIHQ